MHFLCKCRFQALKQVVLHFSNGRRSVFTLDFSTTPEHMKQKIHSRSGIPPHEQRLFFQQNCITCGSALHEVNHGGNISLNLKVKGGAGECDICYSLGEYICDQCNNQVTCKEC